jgi:hypothetical protein
VQKDAAALHKNQGQMQLIAGCDCLSHSPAIFFGFDLKGLGAAARALHSCSETRRDLVFAMEAFAR